jgi:preprotein translocase subunit SecE
MAQAKVVTKTNPLLKPVQFAGEVKREIKKVTWPTRRETILTTVMVFILATLMAIFLFTADQVIAWAIKLILQIKA